MNHLDKDWGCHYLRKHKANRAINIPEIIMQLREQCPRFLEQDTALADVYLLFNDF